jgi:ribonuclease D
MIVIQDKIDKKEIAKLPRAVFEGEIKIVDNEKDSEEAIAFLQTVNSLGIDTETKPSFKKGRVNKVALLQIATHEQCFLFRLNKIGLSKEMIELLTSKKVVKVGLSLKDDFSMLRKRTNFKEQNCIDLQNVVGEFGIEDRSLQKIYANLFQQKISKSQRLSNWEADQLTLGQQKYAALDAWACLTIYERLQELQQNGYQTEKTIEP